jgi:hypothetical protein
MRTKVQFYIVAALVVVSPGVAAAVSPTPAEMAESRRWMAAKFEGVEEKREGGYDAEPFFSFTYGGQPSAKLLGKWKLERNSRELDACRTQHTLTCRDPETGLVVRCTGVAWKDYPTVEWTLHFKRYALRWLFCSSTTSAIPIRSASTVPPITFGWLGSSIVPTGRPGWSRHSAAPTVPPFRPGTSSAGWTRTRGILCRTWMPTNPAR